MSVCLLNPRSYFACLAYVSIHIVLKQWSELTTVCIWWSLICNIQQLVASVPSYCSELVTRISRPELGWATLLMIRGFLVSVKTRLTSYPTNISQQQFGSMFESAPFHRQSHDCFCGRHIIYSSYLWPGDNIVPSVYYIHVCVHACTSIRRSRLKDTLSAHMRSHLEITYSLGWPRKFRQDLIQWTCKNWTLRLTRKHVWDE